MPRGDGTGPSGMGPMTGRSAGYCAGYDTPGHVNHGLSRHFDRGHGKGLRWRQTPVYQPQTTQLTKEQEKQMLDNELAAIEQNKKDLDQEMKSIKKRLEEIKNKQ
jgi:hypothetical protein